MTTIYNNTLRIKGSLEDLSTLPRWEDIGFDEKIESNHNFLFAPIIPNPRNPQAIWGVNRDCIIEDVCRFDGDRNNLATLKLQFDSVDAPPIAGIINLAQIYPNLQFVLEYNHQGEPKTTVILDRDWPENIEVTELDLLNICVGKLLGAELPENWTELEIEDKVAYFEQNSLSSTYTDPETMLDKVETIAYRTI